MQSFESVWQTVNDKHIDPTFGGLDWLKVHDRYKPLITTARNEEEYYLIINKMNCYREKILNLKRLLDFFQGISLNR
jgi:hypothetical protein